MRVLLPAARRTLSLCALATAVLAGAAHAAATPPDRVVARSRVSAHSDRAHSLYVGANDHWAIVDGDGDTDLDCWVYDAAGDLVDSDTDATDYCMLQTPGVGRHRVVIRNLGWVYNEYVLRQR